MTASRERLVEAAAELFLGGSFHRIGIAEICSAAKVNKGTFYHFFPSKLDLLIECLDRYVRETRKKFKCIADSDETPCRKLQRIFEIPKAGNAAWQQRYGSASGCLIGNVILEMAANEPLVRERAENGMHEIKQVLRSVVGEYLASRGATADGVEQATDVLMGLIQGAQVQAKAQNDISVFDRFAAMTPAMLSGAYNPQSFARDRAAQAPGAP